MDTMDFSPDSDLGELDEEIQGHGQVKIFLVLWVKAVYPLKLHLTFFAYKYQVFEHLLLW
jgi:hypothetical protein